MFFISFLGTKVNFVVPISHLLRVLLVNSDRVLRPNKCCSLNPGFGRFARIFLILIGRLYKTENPALNLNIAPPPSPYAPSISKNLGSVILLHLFHIKI